MLLPIIGLPWWQVMPHPGDNPQEKAAQTPHDSSLLMGVGGEKPRLELHGLSTSDSNSAFWILRRVIPLWASAKKPMIAIGSVHATNATNEKPVASSFEIPKALSPVI